MIHTLIYVTYEYSHPSMSSRPIIHNGDQLIPGHTSFIQGFVRLLPDEVWKCQ